jgi:hypothetical protein
MKKLALTLTIALAANLFAQEEEEIVEEEDSPAVVQEQAAPEETKKEEKKPAFHMEKRPDSDVGIRGGIHFSAIGTESATFGWHLGAYAYPVKFWDGSLGGDILGLKVLLEPGLFFLTKENPVLKKNQYWLEVPVNASLLFTVFSMRIRYSVGPFVALGLFGDFEYDYANPKTYETTKEKMSRFDLGLTQTLGYEFAKNLWSDLTVGYGFLDMMKYDNTSTFIFKITAGFNL